MKHYLYILAVLLGLSACSTDSDIVDVANTDNRVIINASIGNNSIFTRSNPLGTAEEQAMFNAGDVIHVTNGTEWAEYKLATDGTTWNLNGGSNLFWHEGENSFMAYYPEKPTTFADGTSACYIETFQSTLEKLIHSDLMTAKVTCKETEDNKLNLSFERITARVIVNVTYGLEYSNADSVTIFTYAFTDEKNDALFPCTMYRNPFDGKYYALVLPSKGYSSEPFLRFEIKDEPSPIVTGIPAMDAGKSYTFNVIVGKDYAKIKSVEVSDWTEKGVLSGLIYNNGIPTIDLDNVKTADNLASTLNAKFLKGQTLKLTGTWNDDYYTPFRNFLTDASVDVTLDLSQVTGMAEIKKMNGGFVERGGNGLAGIILPPSVTTIGESAFNASKITKIELTHVTRIEKMAFEETPIEDITIPSGITYINEYMLRGMGKLKTVTFAGDITGMSVGIFYGDNALTTIDLSNCKTVPTIITGDFGTFYNITPENITVLVKDENMKTVFENNANWKAEGFKEFKVKGSN